MSIKKQFLKTKPECKVSFKLPAELAAGAMKAAIVGDFNNWNESADEMNQLKDGSFSATMNLETGRNYQFRYLLDGNHWVNDNDADGYQPSGFGDAQNSVIEL